MFGPATTDPGTILSDWLGGFDVLIKEYVPMENKNADIEEFALV
jgi:hypothetical protein